jgi:hypothetical protein
MSEENNTPAPETTNDSSAPAEVTIPKDVLEAAVAAQLKDVKEKLDKAYGARDEALAKVAEKELKEREAEIARLTEEGKHKEAFDMQIAQERARAEALEKRVVELSRDSEVRTLLSGYAFRSDSASSMAFKEIVGDLIQNDKQQWVHKSNGKSLQDCIKGFLDDDANSFLLKPKANSGSGSSSASSTNSSNTKKSIFEMSQEEVLALSAEGKLPRRR